MKPMCKNHGTVAAKYWCDVCGFICTPDEETNPTHSFKLITNEIASVYEARAGLHILNMVGQSVSALKVKVLMLLQAEEARISNQINKHAYLAELIEREYSAVIPQRLREQIQLSINEMNKGKIERIEKCLANEAKIFIKKEKECYGNIATEYAFEKSISLGQKLSDKKFEQGLEKWRQKEYLNSIANYKEALQIRIRLYGKDNGGVADTYHNMGTTYDHNKEYANALANYKEALQIRIKLYGKDNGGVADTYYNICLLYTSPSPRDS